MLSTRNFVLRLLWSFVCIAAFLVLISLDLVPAVAGGGVGVHGVVVDGCVNNVVAATKERGKTEAHPSAVYLLLLLMYCVRWPCSRVVVVLFFFVEFENLFLLVFFLSLFK